MKRFSKTLRLSALGLAICCAGVAPAAAQQPDTQRPPLPAPATGDAQQTLRTVTGTVTRFTRAPTGEPDGFVLDNGTAVHYPTYLSGKVTALIEPDARVRVTGIMVEGTDPGAVALIEARTITDLASNRTLDLRAPAAAGAGASDTSGAGGGAAAPNAGAGE